MKKLLLPLALLLPALPAAAQQLPELDLEQSMLLRCSAAFAIIASEQERAAPLAMAYPPLAERGREFFVQAVATLMDELVLDRDAVMRLATGEVEALSLAAAQADDPAAYVDSIMQPCLLALDASGV